MALLLHTFAIVMLFSGDRKITKSMHNAAEMKILYSTDSFWWHAGQMSVRELGKF